ncbi:hypothetical protein [Acinetobacter sp. SA01]|uniref:hypothetical protein n=1 Tax=Acinetobacter sp. SA01 TaxID=1862567 RepID=UPI00140BE5C2|nr:hypothetical protein [Acinetobacter sp. SA01]
MGSKKKLFEPITGESADRVQELCKNIPKDLKKFKKSIYYLDSNQLFQDQFVNQLLSLVNNLDELHYLLTGMIKPKDIYYSSLRTALAALNGTSNVLIITAHYLKPENKYKRLLNQHSFSFELNQIFRKVDFVKQVLERVSKGDPMSRNIPRPTLNFRSRW